MEPTNKLVNPMLTDFYQITMSYAYWKAGVHEEEAVFDLFFRKNPFQGEFAIYAGLGEKLRLFENFHFSDDHIAYLKEQMPQCENGFFDWLKSVDCSRMKIYAFGGVWVSRYSYMGGFDATSNVPAGYLFGVPIKGTHAHSYVQSFTDIEDFKNRTRVGVDGKHWRGLPWPAKK
jgi:nicotinic acid phosphoribosyltransferase